MAARNLGSTMQPREALGHEFSEIDADFGDFTLEQVARRGDESPPIPDATVQKLLARVHDSGVTALLSSWRAEDRDPFLLGGRPALIRDEAILTGLLILATERKAMHLSALADLFQWQLTAAARELLGLEPPLTKILAPTHQRKRWYANTARAFHRIVDVMDPFPQQRWTSKSHAEIAEILNGHDQELELVRRQRLNDFTNAFVAMTYRMQPRSIRRISSSLDISFDQTYMSSPNRKGYSRSKLKMKVAAERKAGDPRLFGPGPVDAFVGWHVKSGDRTDYTKRETDETTPSRPNDTTYAWGWEGNFAVRVDSENPKRRRFPGIIVAATMSLPNKEVAEEAVDLMTYSLRLGLLPGVADADKQYWANSLVSRLHEPAFLLGFTPSTDYRVDRLKPSGGDHGARYLEGRAYCPSTPERLLYATQQYHDGSIDKVTFRERKEESLAYELHKKETKANGKLILACPALGNAPTVICPLRELAKKAANKSRPTIDEEDITPEQLQDKICAQHSASFDPADLRREAQAFPYGTDEWEDFHTHARNSIESLNSQIKSGGGHNLHDSSRRLVRGFAAAQVMMAMIVTAFNMRKIVSFIADTIHEATTGGAKDPKLRRRDREHYNPYTGSYPPGVERPSSKRSRTEAGDGTGGPPPPE
ncbi:hypothetical protein ACFQ9V_13405 [Leifsonia sp. NPDC056665]|uniref:hypothetical protein n=1 Tax=Leifsonia sp. NPDC056665 TaxID=3345901 RepID=UPI00369D3230